MPKKGTPKQNSEPLPLEDKTGTLFQGPVDDDDNDAPDADASGDSEDETPDENEAPDTWQKGED